MSRTMIPIEISKDDKKVLRRIAAKKGNDAQALMAKVVLGLLEGRSATDLAKEFDISLGYVANMAHRVRKFGIRAVQVVQGDRRDRHKPEAAPVAPVVKVAPVAPPAPVKLNKKELILQRNELLHGITHLPIVKLLRKPPSEFGPYGAVWSLATFGEVAHQKGYLPFKPYPATVSNYLKTVGFNWSEYSRLSKEIVKGSPKRVLV